MTLAKSPCPPWCDADHDRYRDHGQTLGHVADIGVYAYQQAGHPPNVSLVDSHGRHPQTVEMPIPDVAALVELIQAAAKVTTSATPQNWPPQPGDVWTDDHREQWLCYSDEPPWAGSRTVYLKAASGRFHDIAPLALAQTFASAGLRLAYRPEAQPEPTAVPERDDPWGEPPF